MIRQRTIRNPVRASGNGLHSGQKVFMSLLPAGLGFLAILRDLELALSDRALVIENLGPLELRVREMLVIDRLQVLIEGVGDVDLQQGLMPLSVSECCRE